MTACLRCGATGARYDYELRDLVCASCARAHSEDNRSRTEGPATLRNPDPSHARPVQWAWKGRIPIGRASLIVGNEGVGKGTVVAWLASRASKGTLAGDLYGTPFNVLIVGDEDALEDTWTPRLYAAGAEWRHVWFPPEDCAELNLTTPADIERLRKWVRDYAIRVVVFDALLDHLGGASVDEFKPKGVRNALRPLRRLAADEGFAAVGSMHPRKGRALAFRDLIAASHQFNAISRSSLLLAEHPEDEARRVLLRGKGNLAGVVKALEFRIRSHVFELKGHTFDMPHAVDWEESELQMAEVLAGGGGGGPGRPRDEDNRDKVEAALTETPQSVRAVAEVTGIPKSTVQRILEEFADDFTALKSEAGWVSHNYRLSNYGTPQDEAENGSTKPNPVSQNVPSEKGSSGGVWDTPNGNVHFSSETDEWATPQDFFDEMNAEFRFDLDVCALPDNAKCERYFTPEQDGLAQTWKGTCWMNPPYGREIGRWIEKAWQSAQAGATVVCLVPARTDTAWWQDYCQRGEIRFLRGRLKFGGAKNGAPFPSAVVVFEHSSERDPDAELERLQGKFPDMFGGAS